ncbi:Rna-binding protein 10, partial [Globisporangium splendens]
MNVLASFRPLQARIILNKVRFLSGAHPNDPLRLDHRPVAIGFTENNRSSDRWHGNGENRAAPFTDSTARGGPRLDWICTQCHGTNFARRSSCFKCDAVKSEDAKEIPAGQTYHPGHRDGPPHGPPGSGLMYGGYHENERDAPSNVLVIRMIPENVEEGELHVAFAEFEGVQDIRLIRDRLTNLSRGFGFVEFVNVELFNVYVCVIQSATKALNGSGDLRIQGSLVRVSYARDHQQQQTKQYPNAPASSTVDGPSRHVANPIAVAALEQAQWSLANGYGANQQERSQSDMEADVNALLESAAAAVIPRVVEPKKQWPLPFETGGGSYVFASEYGLYYDPDSLFYYDTQSKLYYNSFTGAYYRCSDGSKGVNATFEPFTPPAPVDDATYSRSAQPVKNPQSIVAAGATAAVGGFSMNLNKKDKKKKPISFGIKAAAGAESNKAKETTAFAAAAGSTAVVGSSTKHKSAVDIAKWSQLQRDAKAAEEATLELASEQKQLPKLSPVASKPVPAEANAKNDVTNLVDAVAEAPICLLCRRKFSSIELLRKHESLSKLHQENLAKAKANKEVLETQYREMVQERNDRLGDETKERGGKRQRVSGATFVQHHQSTGAAPELLAPTPSAALESGIGGKMLKMMGWKSGEGLGKHGTGITAPVTAIGNTGGETVGIGMRTAKPATPPIDASDVASYKERLQQMVRSRYDAADANSGR